MIQDRYLEIANLALEISERFQMELDKLGFTSRDVTLMDATEASFHLEKDPSNGEYSLVGDWVDSSGAKLGSLQFHHDGSFFAEQDVVKPHPRKKKWFVEAVNAWGKGTRIKAEARLLPMP